jgi:hypothetical protein
VDRKIDDKPPVFSSKKTPGVVYFRDIYRKRISRVADPTNHVAFSSLSEKQTFLHDFCNPRVTCIAKTMEFVGICEAALNGFASFFIQFSTSFS